MYEYRFLLDDDDLLLVYEKFTAGDIWWAFYHDYEGMTRQRWLDTARADGVGVIGGYVDGRLGGVMTIQPFRGKVMTQCAEIGVAACREYFSEAEPLSRGAFLWAFERLDCESMVGFIPVSNRHSLRMAPRVGFRELCRVPKMCWYERRQRFEDGVLVCATPESVIKASEV